MSEPSEAPERHSRIRAIFAGVVGVIAIIGLLASVISLWAHWVVFSDDAIGNAAGAAIAQPEVSDALAQRVTDEVFTAVDAEAFVKSVLPSALASLAPALVGGLETRVEARLATALESDTAQQLVVGAVDRAHAGLVRVLEGDGLLDGVSVQNGEVTLNLLPLLGRGVTALQDLGLLSNVTLPDLSAGGDPTQQIAALEESLGRDLPDDLGQIVVYQSDRLSDAGETVQLAQDVVVIAKRAMLPLLILTVVAWVGAILLANRRRRALLIMFLGTAAVMIVARALVRAVVRNAPDVADQPGGRATIDAVVTSLTGGLVTAVTLIAIVGLIGAGVMYLTGAGARAQAMRGSADRASGSALVLVNEHRDATAIAAFAAAVVVLAVAGLGWGSVIVATLLAAVGVWALWAPGRIEASS